VLQVLLGDIFEFLDDLSLEIFKCLADFGIHLALDPGPNILHRVQVWAVGGPVGEQINISSPP
jgi:transcription elongation factor GreA-like protein